MTDLQIKMAINQVRLNLKRTGEPYDRLYSGITRTVAYNAGGMVLFEIHDDKGYPTAKRKATTELILEMAQLEHTLNQINVHYLPMVEADYEFNDITIRAKPNPECHITGMINNYFEGYESLEATIGEIEEYLINKGDTKGLTDQETGWLKLMSDTLKKDFFKSK